MAATSPVELALGRLQMALDRVESAIEQSLENQRQVAGLEGELQRLGTDRSRLAQSLDAAEARTGRVEEANREVSRRLVAGDGVDPRRASAQQRSLNRGKRDDGPGQRHHQRQDIPHGL